MPMTAQREAVWFGQREKELIFYPFGIGGAGYRIPRQKTEKIARWTFWRAQMPIFLWNLGFIPIVVFWGPTLSGSGRLSPLSLAISLTLLAALVGTVTFIVNRATYAWLLKDFPVMDRCPTRSEKQASSRQFGPTRGNLPYAPLPVTVSGATTGVLAVMKGAFSGDALMVTLGALLLAVFSYALVKRSFGRLGYWILFRAPAESGRRRIVK